MNIIQRKLRKGPKLAIFIFSPLLLALWCEFAIYYAVILKCSWPSLKGGFPEKETEVLRALFIADTHLLGPYRGHWFDKLRREWQMHRAFQTAVTIHRPEVVFFLGDLFDEGMWVDSGAFHAYVSRFKSLFKVPADTDIIVVPGNHDMGFHYELLPQLNSRFNQAFNTTSVKLLKIKGSSFVLINSMAMHRDGCFLCHSAEVRLRNIGDRLRCEKDSKGSENCKALKDLSTYSRPILLQHFPMYRVSDMVCTEPDAPPFAEKQKPFREKWECLSKESTTLLLETLQPRLVLSGHTHHGCLVNHSIKAVDGLTPEHSVPSFSWRNRNNPSFFMGTISPSEYSLSKCYMPEESTVIYTYIVSAVCATIYVLIVFCIPWLRSFCLRRKKES